MTLVKLTVVACLAALPFSARGQVPENVVNPEIL